MSEPARLLLDEPREEPPVTPGVDAWRAMTAAEREAYLAQALAVLQREAELMSEGSPHFRPKNAALQTLEDYFQRIGRKVYLASELPVHYPAEAPFAPDLMAVLDVEDPGEDDLRMAWVVADEGRGLDLVLEVLYQGNRHKDLVDNVRWYARMGIPEYLVYDRLRQRVIGYRLPAPDAVRYEQIPSRGGLLASGILGLELGIVGGRLRFFHGGNQVQGNREVLARVTAMVEDIERRAEDEARRAEEESRRAEEEARRAEEEARRAEEAERRAEAEAAARAELEKRLAELTAKLGGA